MAKAPKGQSELSSDDCVNGVENFLWPGRFHRISHSKLEWFLDGAHNEPSAEHAVQWYNEITLETQEYDAAIATQS